MILPIIGFVVTALLAVRVIIQYNLALSRAANRLKQAYASAGSDWDYMRNFAFRWQLFSQPESILESNDSPEIREAKEGLISCRAGMTATIWKGIKILLLGFVGTILLGILELGIRRFL